ncbi:MAG TPA: hypothetical protein VGO68_16230 [Pyrinomonadaceae bacterium]|jgi:hypothetical protein|nr:hypothetical protein [Pyrinomonadaceae bacterium]
MEFISSQILPPSDWECFEQLCTRIFQEVWQDPYATRVGESGQSQDGVDIVSSISPYKGVQCKKRDISKPPTLIVKEIAKIVEAAESFKPPIALLIIATTLDKDSKLEEYTRQLAERRRSEGKFEVHLLSWDDLKLLINKHRSVLREFYASHYAHWLATESLLERSRSLTPLKHLTSLLQIYDERALDESLNPLWDQCAYSFLQRVKFSPLESENLSGPKATCLSVSREDDWLLALGRANGSLTVRRLRVDKRIDGVIHKRFWTYDARDFLVDLSSIDHEVFTVGSSVLAGLEFLGGGVVSNELRVRARPSQIFDFTINAKEYSKKTRYDGPPLTLTLPDLQPHEEFFEIEEIRLSQTPTIGRHRSMIAVTTSGRCFKSDIAEHQSDNPQPEVALTLAGKPIRIRRYDDYRDGVFLVVSTTQVIVIDARRSYSESIFAAEKVKIRDAAILNPFAMESKRVLIGYDDGSIDLIDNNRWNGLGAERLILFDDDSPITLLETSETHGVFAAADSKRHGCRLADGQNKLHQSKLPADNGTRINR